MEPTENYLQQKYGLQVIVRAETDPSKVTLGRIYQTFRKLTAYWTTARESQTSLWIQGIGQRLFDAWIRGDTAYARDILKPSTIRRIESRRRRGNNDPTLPKRVCAELCSLMAELN